MEQNATLTKDKKGAINVSTFSQKIHSYLKHPFSLLVWIITILADRKSTRLNSSHRT